MIVQPSLEEFSELAKQRRVISVYAKLLADDVTPVSVYQSLCGAREQTFLLESADAGVWSRWSFIGVRTASTLTETGGRAQWLGRELVGIPDDDTTTFPAATARRKGLTVAVVRRMPEVYPRAIDLLARGRVQLAPLVSDRFGIDAAAAAFAFASGRTGLKTVIDPGA